jgi:hypothetical protein
MLFLEVNIMNDEGKEGPKNGQSKVQKLWFLNKKGERVEVECHECEQCKETVPVINTPCADCGTPYIHWKTIEIPEGEEKGFLYFIYRCSGCVGNAQKAQKILKPLAAEK